MRLTGHVARVLEGAEL